MSTLSLGLNYPTLLAMPDQSALLSALSTAYATNISALLTRKNATLGVPVNPPKTSPTVTQVPIINAYPVLGPPQILDYVRMDLGLYLKGSQRYIDAATVAAGIDAVTAWLISTHGLYFESIQLSLGALAVDPVDATRQVCVVDVLDGNYVWVGSLTLYAVTSTHPALLAIPGISTGIRLTDVGLPQST